MIENRKEEHIRIAEKAAVSSEYNYWDDVKIIHQAIPEVDFDRIDTSVNFLGRSSSYPFLISSMTGGTDLAKRINGNLAAAAEHFGVGMGVGSMRAAVEKNEICSWEFIVYYRTICLYHSYSRTFSSTDSICNRGFQVSCDRFPMADRTGG